jgi:hypothetical protein
VRRQAGSIALAFPRPDPFNGCFLAGWRQLGDLGAV